MSLISVTTSLVPGRDTALQTVAIESWMAHGFTVCSINAPSEADQVRREFPDVRVVAATRTAEKAVGKPLPFVMDLLREAAAQDPQAKLTGFINSDIILRGPASLPQTLVDQARSCAVLLPRVDVPNLDAVANFKPTGREHYSIGYDGVFLPPPLITVIPENLFSIGMPFWDYWLPLVLLLQGHGLKTVASPIALHVGHATRWDKSVYLFFHAMMSDALKVAGAQKSASAALEVALDMLCHVYQDVFTRATRDGADEASIGTLAAFYDRLQEVAVHHIKAKAQPLLIPESVGA
jgi:hypothetical protein